MINLKSYYGNKIFERKYAYANVSVIPTITRFFLDIALTVIIVKVFDVKWDYAFLKVLGLLILYGIAAQFFTYIVTWINHKLVVKNALAMEMRHYMAVFDKNVPWDEIGCYDDYLLESAFNPSLDVDLRVLSAMNYATIVNTYKTNAGFEDRCYEVFNEVAPEFVKRPQ